MATDFCYAVLAQEVTESLIRSGGAFVVHGESRSGGGRMSWSCPGCGQPRLSFIGAVVHCDPSEPIDDLSDTDAA